MLVGPESPNAQPASTTQAMMTTVPANTRDHALSAGVGCGSGARVSIAGRVAFPMTFIINQYRPIQRPNTCENTAHLSGGHFNKSVRAKKTHSTGAGFCGFNAIMAA